jgi:peptidoglycan/LPS O-acetylase OafA/YrhL
MVFGTHYISLPWGWAGVDVFFVLSGFLITGILFDTQHDPHRVRNFYVRRTLRIFPLYYGLMLLLVLLYPVFRWDWNLHWLVWPAYIGNFARGIHPYLPYSQLQMLADAQPLSQTFPHVQLRLGHFWSLCVEEQFYLFWPWIVFLVKDRRKLIAICAACVVACPLMRILATHTLPQYMLTQDVLYRWTPFRIDALLLGGLVALLLRGPHAPKLIVTARSGFILMSCALALCLALSPAARHKPAGYLYPTWTFTWGLTLIDIFAACLIVVALNQRSLIFRVFNLSPLRWIGRISYGAYVFHDILHSQFEWLIKPFNLHGHSDEFATAALALTVTLLLAWASFRWFEGPFIRLKDRLTRRA